MDASKAADRQPVQKNRFKLCGHGLVLVFIFLLFIPVAVGSRPLLAQTSVPAGSDLPTLIRGGDNNLQLQGGVTWNSALNNTTAWNFTIDGNGQVINVRNNTYMIENLQRGSTITIQNARVISSGATAGNYLIGLGDGPGAIATTLNLEGTTFDGFYSTRYKGGGIIYPYGDNHQVTINGGTAGVTFSNNRSQDDSAGALPVNFSDLTVNGKITFDSNRTGNYGGAMAVYSEANSVTFNGETNFFNNHAVVFGGAIDVWGGGNSLVNFNGVSTFDGNYVYHETAVNADSPPHITDQNPRGGAINIGYIGNGPTTVTFDNAVSFRNNRVINVVGGRTSRGGAVSVYGNGPAKNYQLIFNDSALFEGNYAVSTNGLGDGGAIFYDSSAALLHLSSGTQFLNNSASRYGGAIYLQAGTIDLNAITGDIVFQGNRQGVSIDGSNVPVSGTGKPNAIYLGTGGNLNFAAGAGSTIHFYDPIASAAGTSVIITKTGGGEVAFYGDNGATDDYHSLLQATTRVNGGNFTLTDGVHYGGAGAVTISNGGTFRGGNNARLLAGSVTAEATGGLGAVGGLFTVESANINLRDGSFIRGSGTLAATSNFNIAGQITGEVTGTDQLNLTALLAGGGGLSKTGTGTLRLDAVSTYTGATSVNAGTLSAGAANVYASSSRITVAAGAVLDLNGYSQTAKNLSGGGTISLDSALLNVENSENTVFSGLISGNGGQLRKTGTADLTLSGSNTYTGGTLIDQGRLIIQSGTALGTGQATVNSPGQLVLNLAADGTVANVITGNGAVSKIGTTTATLSADSSMGSLTVSQGRLGLTSTAHLTVAGQYLQDNQAILAVNLGPATQPAITAGSASLDGTLEITGLSLALAGKASELENNRRIIISSGSDIVGNFDNVNFSSSINLPGYLVLGGQLSSDKRNYSVGVGLAWRAPEAQAHGTFDLVRVGDSFEVDVVLADRDDLSGGGAWDGQSLTETGLGNLILSENNTYTGATDILGGTLTAGRNDVFAQSRAVTVASGATLNLAGYSQTARNLTGGGVIALGAGTLTIDNSSSTDFGGRISGLGGGLIKTGDGDLTLSGSNSYTGGTTISRGRLIVENASALGTGAVNNSDTLELALTADGAIANQLTGSGTVYKTGTSTATLTAAGSSVGDFFLSGGNLALTGPARLNVSGEYAQSASAGLAVAYGSGAAAITAGSVYLDGTLSITGFDSGAAPASASALASQSYAVIRSTADITGYFKSVSFDRTASTPDYLTLGGQVSADRKSYLVGLGLSWLAALDAAGGTFTLADVGDTFNVDVILADRTRITSGWDGQSLTKSGDGELILSRANTYTGLTDVQAGTLTAGAAEAFAASRQVQVASGAVLNLNGYNQTARNLTGQGAISLGAAQLTVNSGSSTEFSGVISGSGSLVKTGSGAFTLSGVNTYSGGTTISQGRLIISNAEALGTGVVNNNSQLELALTADGTISNVISGTGALIKSGAATAVLGANSAAGAVTVNDGTLKLAPGVNLQANSLTTASGATTDLRAGASLNLTGAFTHSDGAILNLTLGGGMPVTAASVSLDGILNVEGFTTGLGRATEATQDRHIIITSGSNIDGDFDTVAFGGVSSGADYLILNGQVDSGLRTYSVGFQLAWNAAVGLAHGNFTLPDAADIFDLNIALADRTDLPPGYPWDGRSLTKRGLGTLILSAANTYTGDTDIQAGTLITRTINAFEQSRQIKVGGGAVLNLENFNQVARNLTGAGQINLGSAQLTVINSADTDFSGLIAGSGGSLVKSGASDFTLSGENTYGGGTTISQGRLIIENGSAMGGGTVTLGGGSLLINLTADGVVANQLAGTGTVTKTGTTTATLTSPNTGAPGLNLAVTQGMLSMAPAGSITVGNVTTSSGATTDLRPGAFLNVANNFIQENGSNLKVGLSNSSQAVITANQATLDGNLFIDGFSIDLAKATVITALPRRVVIESNQDITTNFTGVDFGGQSSGLDFLFLTGQVDSGLKTYSVGFELAWTSADTTKAHGTFTLPNENIFEVDVELDDRSSITSGWDGQTLTKLGDGNLILSAVNGYTGATDIQAGTLTTGVADAFAQSSEIKVTDGAKLNLNDFSQTAKYLSGQGTINLGEMASTRLTVTNTAAAGFDGLITGSGGLAKTGSGPLTLTAANNYSGGTFISAGGSIIAQNASALGTGVVNMDGTSSLTLNLAVDGTVANQLTGAGSLSKTGAGIIFLTAANSSVGQVEVGGGTLGFQETGIFNVANGGDYTTKINAATVIDADSKLLVDGTFEQESGSTLTVQASDSALEPAIIAGNAVLAGNLIVQDMNVTVANVASELENRSFTVVQSGSAITTDFDNITFVNTADPVPGYLTTGGWKTDSDTKYKVGIGLTWLAGPEKSHGTFEVAGNQTFELDIALDNQIVTPPNTWNGQSLTKTGAGELIISEVQDYTGRTSVLEGTLTTSDKANVLNSSTEVIVGADGTWNLDTYDQTARNLSGEGAINLGTANLTVDNTVATSFDGTITGQGGLTKDGGDSLALSGDNSYSGGTVITDVAGNKLIIESATALGSGQVQIGNDADLTLDLAADGTIINQLTGNGSLTKEGSSTVIMTGTNSSVGQVTVNAGNLHINSAGSFEAAQYTTVGTAGTIIGAGSQLQVNGQFTQAAGSNLSVYVGGAGPAVTADNANLQGKLTVMGLNTEETAKASELDSRQFTVVRSTNDIVGKFDTFQTDATGGWGDYLAVTGGLSDDLKEYNVGLGLSWYTEADKAQGGFTLVGAEDTFEVDVALVDRTGITNPGWDGQSLTKKGAGELILSADNSYTGTTDVQAGTLTAGRDNVFEDSSQVMVNAGATLSLGAFDQIAQRLSDGADGGGTVDLGTAALNVGNTGGNSSFSGKIVGNGSLVKTGNGTMTLGGVSTYSGGTTVNDGLLVASNAVALGTGTVTNNSRLELNLDHDGTVVNVFQGTGSLDKTGTGSATLTGDNSQAGQVRVLGGDLTLGPQVDFGADSFEVATQTSLTLDRGAKLNVDNAFTMEDANSTLTVVLGSGFEDTQITAGSAQLRGLLNVDTSGLTRAGQIGLNDRYIIVRSDNVIGPDTFSTVSFGGRTSGVDYLLLDGQIDPGDLSYSVGLELAWTSQSNRALGTFTLADPDDVFEVDVALNDNLYPTITRWSGRDLTKNGAGTLILSAENGYTGTTTVNGGLLSLTHDAALGRTSLLATATGAGVALNGTSQTVGRLNTGSGSNLDFGGGLLTIDQNQREPGDSTDSLIAGNTLTGNGGLVLSPATATVSGGNNGFTGDVTVMGGSRLILNDAAGVGSQGLVSLIKGVDELIFDLSSPDQQSFTKCLTGNGLVSIADNSDLRLSGDASGFSGRIEVEAGSKLTASEAGNLGWSRINLDGTMTLEAAENWMLLNTVTGPGEFIKNGEGQLLVYGNMSDFTGRAWVREGALILGNAEYPDVSLGAAAVDIAAGGLLSGLGTVSGSLVNAGAIQALNSLPGYEGAAAGNLTVGPLHNSGIIALNGTTVGNTLTVRGGLTSDRGRLILNTVLGGDDSPTDRLILDGGRTIGSTALTVINQGGQGAATQRGILVVEAINGATTAEDAFNLSSSSRNYRAGLGSLVAGAYDYSLLRGGHGGQEESWYLVSAFGGGGEPGAKPMARPEAGMLLAGRDAAGRMFMDSLYDRLMSYKPLSENAEGGHVLGTVWGRMEGGRTRSYANHKNLKNTADSLVFDIGLDLGSWSDPNYGSFATGLMFGLGRVEIDTESRVDRNYRADGDIDGYSVGLYGTWFQHQDRREGFYADAWVKRSWFDHSVKGRGLPEESFNSRLWSASLEGGYSATIFESDRAQWSFDPSFQAVYNQGSGGPGRNGGALVGGWADNSWVTRLGGRVHGRIRTDHGIGLSPYFEANWRHDTASGRVLLDHDAVQSDRPKNTAEFKLGLAADWAEGLSATIGLTTELGADKFRHVGGQAGVRFEW